MKVRKWSWRRLPVLIGLGGVVFYYQYFLPEQIRSNERHASNALTTLSSAEADFRSNDRDGNGVKDFWTADVAGLYALQPKTGVFPQGVQLIDRDIARADARPLKPLDSKPVPYHGYLFIALDQDDSDAGTPEEHYKRDTGGNLPMGKVHNTSKFGFCAYPAKYGVTGKFTYIINENNTIFWMDTGGTQQTHWPEDSKVQATWVSVWVAGSR